MKRSALSALSIAALSLTLAACPGEPQPDPEICDQAPAAEPMAGTTGLAPMLSYDDAVASTTDGRIAILVLDSTVSRLALRIWDGFAWNTAHVTPEGATLTPAEYAKLAIQGDRFVVATAYSTPDSAESYRVLVEGDDGTFAEAPVEGSLPSPSSYYLARAISEPYLDRVIILLGDGTNVNFTELGEDGRVRSTWVNESSARGQPLTAGYNDDLTPWVFIRNYNAERFVTARRVGSSWVAGSYNRLVYEAIQEAFAVTTPFGTAGGRYLAWGYVERISSESIPWPTRFFVVDLATGTTVTSTELGRGAAGTNSGLQTLVRFSEAGDRLHAFTRERYSNTASYRLWDNTGEAPALGAAKPYRPDLAIHWTPIPVEACGRELMFTLNAPVGGTGPTPLRLEPLFQ